jgi:hypothetical protein
VEAHARPRIEGAETITHLRCAARPVSGRASPGACTSAPERARAPASVCRAAGSVMALRLRPVTWQGSGRQLPAPMAARAASAMFVCPAAGAASPMRSPSAEWMAVLWTGCLAQRPPMGPLPAKGGSVEGAATAGTTFATAIAWMTPAPTAAERDALPVHRHRRMARGHAPTATAALYATPGFCCVRTGRVRPIRGTTKTVT